MLLKKSLLLNGILITDTTDTIEAFMLNYADFALEIPRVVGGGKGGCGVGRGEGYGNHYSRLGQPELFCN